MLDPRIFPSQAKFGWIMREKNDQTNLEHLPGLLDEERACIETAVDVRRSQFADARFCAHKALGELGFDKGHAIVKGDRGMPVFPPLAAGSITHSEGLRAAVVVPKLLVASIGLDAEPVGSLPDRVLQSIARATELPQLKRLQEMGIPSPDKLLFCAKEATYKAWFPMTRRWLGFEEAEIELREDGTFISYLLVRPTPVPFINGRWMINKGFIIAATVVTE